MIGFKQIEFFDHTGSPSRATHLFDYYDYLRLLRLCASVDSGPEGVGKMAQGTLAPTLPSEDEAILAKETSRILASRVQTAEPLRLRMLDDPAKGTVKIPASALRMLVHILEEMARGNAVTLIPVHAALTTQEAADMFNISRPSLIQLLDDGEIEFRRVGTPRRRRFDGLMAYKRRADADRRAALAELAAYDQELGI